ncbi:MAG: hypothetical protein B7Z66_08800 [Chromatiales bacterium 21-64-14]|nr:MAG: hypothetical protein B7Z66_08800 [Chromatiales bacterium 21-64-14]HQU16120.1 C13 family peptidase [Gammaproteobacteria bacterium]
MKEVRYARKPMDRRFDTRGRAVVIINNRDTVGNIPLVSATNLKRILLRIGTVMDPKEDILFLYITTHGEPGRLSMWFPWLQLNDLNAGDRHRMLVAAGIKWKVLVISAGYSGSFIDALKDDDTLILTAAAANRTSFDCSNENDFTYCGEAFLRDQLAHRYSLTDAFLAARLQATPRRYPSNGGRRSAPRFARPSRRTYNVLPIPAGTALAAIP